MELHGEAGGTDQQGVARAQREFEKSRTSGRGTDGIAKGDDTRVAISNISRIRGGAQLLEFSRHHDCSGRYRVQSRAGCHSVDNEARYTAAFALQPSGLWTTSRISSSCQSCQTFQPPL